MVECLLLIIITIIFIIFQLNKYIKLTKRHSLQIEELSDRLAKFERKELFPKQGIAKTPAAAPSHQVAVKPAPLPAPDSAGVSQNITKQEERKATPQIDNSKAAFPGQISKPGTEEVSPRKSSNFWLRLEKQLVENWTGIAGAVIMVMGVGFFGIYTALKLSPLFRFLMVIAFSGILGGLFYYLKPKPGWLKLALWFRSSAGAILLFACLGAGGIPGLQWIEKPSLALFLLLVGILVNLYLGFVGGRQVLASLHVLLSLVALSIAPQSSLTFIIALIVSIYGISLTYREKWDYHLFLTISSFFLYHLLWYFKTKGIGFTGAQNLLGILGVAIVGVSAAFVHYREVYRKKIFDLLPFSVHLLNWLYLGISLLLHSSGSKWKTLFMVIGAIAAFFLARKAKKSGIRWLYQTDTLTAQLIALMAAISLTTWKIDILTIMGIVFLQSLVFLIIMLKEKEELLYRIGTYVMHLLGLILIFTSFILIDYQNKSVLYSHAIILLVCAVIGTAFHIYTLKKQPDIPFKTLDYPFNGSNYSVLAILIGFMVVAIYANLYRITWAEYFIVLIAIPLIYARQRFQSNSLGVGILILLTGAHFIFWAPVLMMPNTMNGYTRFAHSLPFLILSFSIIKWSYLKSINKYLTWIGIYLLTLNIFILGYVVFNPISPLIPGVIWLILSLVVLEISIYLGNKYSKKLEFWGQPDRFLLHIGYFLIFAFILRHLLVHLQSENYFGIFKIRLLIELLAIGTFSYWACCRWPEEDEIYKSRFYLHPLFVELILLFSSLTISLEIRELWHPIIWIGLAFGCLYAGHRFPGKLSRLRFYSLLFSWVTAFQVAFLTSSYVTPSIKWYDQAWLSGCAAILFQFLFLYYFYHYGQLKDILLPESVRFIQSWIKTINRKTNPWVFYPVMVCTAIFLYWSFDKSILTLLWVIECFLVFALSVLLRENHFRYLALAGLGASIIRLIFYDLSQANTITRAFVFLGVGIIMLGINSIYNKYKNRFICE